MNMNTNTFLFDPKKQISELCLRGPNIVLAHLVAVLSESVGSLFPEKDPSAMHDNLALALGHHIQPLASALVRLPTDIVVYLGPAEP